MSADDLDFKNSSSVNRILGADDTGSPTDYLEVIKGAASVRSISELISAKFDEFIITSKTSNGPTTIEYYLSNILVGNLVIGYDNDGDVNNAKFTVVP